MASPRTPIFSPRVTGFIGVTVVVTWTVSIFADILIAAYAPSPFIHSIMAAFAGAIAGNQILRGGDRNGNGNGNGRSL